MLRAGLSERDWGRRAPYSMVGLSIGEFVVESAAGRVARAGALVAHWKSDMEGIFLP